MTTSRISRNTNRAFMTLKPGFMTIATKAVLICTNITLRNNRAQELFSTFDRRPAILTDPHVSDMFTTARVIKRLFIENTRKAEP